MDNNDQTLTKLGRNWSKWQVSPSGRCCPTTLRQYGIARSSLFWFGITEEEKLMVSTFENSQNVT